MGELGRDEEEEGRKGVDDEGVGRMVGVVLVDRMMGLDRLSWMEDEEDLSGWWWR